MTKSRDLANAATALNAVTATEIGYVDGVTSAIQTQLDAKAPTASPVFTGNVTSGSSFVIPNDGYVYWGPGDGSTSIQGNSATDIIKFTTVGSERMRVDSSGTVGIGTSSPNSTNKLDVVADAADRRIAMRTQNTTGQATIEAQVNNYWSGTTYAGTALVQNDSATTGTTVGLSNANLGVLRFQNGSAGLIYTNGSAPIVFGTTATERMRIDASGYLSKAALRAPKELWTVSATAATGTIQYDLASQGVLYYTTNSSGNFTLNFRGDSGTTLNSLMNTGDAITASFLATNSTAYYQSTAVTVDGAAATIKWSGGTAPTTGNASAIDAYSYTIIKTANATFTVLCAGPVKYA